MRVARRADLEAAGTTLALELDRVTADADGLAAA
jgi:hypothetical protein